MGANAAANAPMTPVAAGGFSWPAMAVVAIGLGIGAGLAFQTFDGEPKPAPVLTAVIKTPPTATGATTREPPPAAPASISAPAHASVETRAAGPRGPDRLAEEVEILSRAQTELHAGRFTSSLRLLEEHARKFPRGALTQERVAARVQALCGGGRRTEANAELARLSPGSLHAARAREACATSAKK
jgi:hypothetical protein